MLEHGLVDKLSAVEAGVAHPSNAQSLQAQITPDSLRPTKGPYRMASVYTGPGQSVGGALGLPFLQPSKAGKAISKSGASSPARLRQRQLPSASRGRWIIARYAVAIRCETQAGSGVRAHLAGSFEEGSEETTHILRERRWDGIYQKSKGGGGGAERAWGSGPYPSLAHPSVPVNLWGCVPCLEHMLGRAWTL